MTKPLIEAAFGRKTQRQPIWFLRQAGRYLPEYQKVRSQLGFVELCRNPKLAAEVTIQPLCRFDLDAAIIFSDILIPCTAMGQELTFGKGHGPQLFPPVREMKDVQALKIPHAEKDLGYVGEAIVETKKMLKPQQTMIGFAGAPFTVASYMVEGQGSKEFTEIKRLLYTEPHVLKALLEKLAQVTVSYLMMQVKAGAECLMLFDTWAAQLPASDYREYEFPAVNHIMQEMKRQAPQVPLIYYPGQGAQLYYELQGIHADVIAVDWRNRLETSIRILKETGLDVTVQGNLDPQVLIGSEQLVREKVRAIVAQGKKARAHIFNVGHGLLPHVNPEAITWAIDEVRRLQGT